MNGPDTVTVQAAISWLEVRLALENFLGSDSPLPGEIRERELIDLQVLIGKARRRLVEKVKP